MEIKFIQANRKLEDLFSALFLGAILCNVLATLQWLRGLPVVLAGSLIPLLYARIPSQKRKTASLISSGILAVYFLIRFSSILDGWKLLANQMFRLSEQTQAYAYDYFAVSGESSLETLLFATVLAGVLCALWHNIWNAVLCGIWIAAMAYFGVTPGVQWLVFLVLAGMLSVLPSQQKWFHGSVAAVLLVAIAFAVIQLAPEPNKAVSALDDRLRDSLAAAPMTYEQTPVPTEVPEPEIIPEPQVEREQPEHGVRRAVINVLFLLLAALTLALLFIPAFIKDRGVKLCQKNRAGLNDEDHAAAIRAMYLYAQRWRSLSDLPCEIPSQVYATWQEAAYSNHAMTARHREVVHRYMVETAEAVWAASGYRKRLRIRYRICL